MQTNFLLPVSPIIMEYDHQNEHKRGVRDVKKNDNKKEALYWSCGNSIKCMNEYSTYMTVTS